MAGPDAGGSFYLKVNGGTSLVRGATYTPDLLYRYDPDRDAAILSYARDLGVNMLRLGRRSPPRGSSRWPTRWASR